MLRTLMPWPLGSLAGMKSEVDPFLRLICIRSGWKSEQ